MQQTSPPATGLFGWVARKPRQASGSPSSQRSWSGSASAAPAAARTRRRRQGQVRRLRHAQQRASTRADLNDARARNVTLAATSTPPNSAPRPRRPRSRSCRPRPRSQTSPAATSSGTHERHRRPARLEDPHGPAHERHRRSGHRHRPVPQGGRAAEGRPLDHPGRRPQTAAQAKAVGNGQDAAGASSTKTEESHSVRGQGPVELHHARGQQQRDHPLQGAEGVHRPRPQRDRPAAGPTRLYEPGTFYLDVTGSYTIDVQVFKRPS